MLGVEPEQMLAAVDSALGEIEDDAVIGRPIKLNEGEKKADLVPTLFPGHIGTTSVGGARAPQRSNWAPLAGRNIIVWPDHNEPGHCYAHEVAALATA